MTGAAFLFPGQGAQSVGMAGELCQRSAAARALFDQAAEILSYDLLDICTNGPEDKLNSTVISQPALFVSSLAALEAVRAGDAFADGPLAEAKQAMEACDYCAGLSLGEYTAVTFAGVMDFETGLKVVKQRGEAMQAAADAVESGMVSVLAIDLPEVEALCDQLRGDDVLQVANILCRGNTAVSGSKAACLRVVSYGQETGGYKAIELAVAGAFHTSLMQSAVDKLRSALEDATLSTARIPVVSNVDAAPHTDPDEIRELLVRQVVSPVRWRESVEALIGLGCETFYEVGAGRVLAGLMKRIDRKKTMHSIPA